VPVDCFRAPSFSITARSLWALDLLAEEGFRIDSSIFPTRRNRCGISTANPLPHEIETAAGALCEFPLAVHRMGRWRMPISGGGYFRLLPYRFTRRCLAALNRAGQPFSFYIHPWEVDPAQPRIRGASRMNRFRHYVNLKTTEAKLDRLLGAFRFGTISQAVAEYQQSADADAPRLAVA
jgi:polysaccharide deacetylase family protein (PEP-CTERM system associated)